MADEANEVINQNIQPSPNRFKKYFGHPGLHWALIIASVVGISLYWKKLKTLPTVQAFFHQAMEESETTAHAKLSIALLHLEGDTNQDEENRIKRAVDDISFARLLSVDKKIDPAQFAEDGGYGEARKVLEQSGAEILIWGSASNRYWIALHPSLFKQGNRRIRKLPDVGEGLSMVLELMMADYQTDMRSEDSHYVNNQLKPDLDNAAKLAKDAISNWDEESRFIVSELFADALMTYGLRKGERDSLREAVKMYQGILITFKPGSPFVDLSLIQEKMGTTLQTLGERGNDVKSLKEAIDAYRTALKDRSRTQYPLVWAADQNKLGTALQVLGEHENKAQFLEEAITAYREALKERTRARKPMEWADTQNNLGAALARLGEREKDTQRLEEAVAAYREALKERTRDRKPLEWAMTQNNLGAALSSLGERDMGVQKLKDAVVAYREVLKEWTRGRAPLDWATAQNNLSTVLLTLGLREQSIPRLKEAIAACREALKEQTNERAPLARAMTQNNLGMALRALGHYESDPQALQEAYQAFDSAWQAYRQAKMTHYDAYFEQTLKALKQEIQDIQRSGFLK